MRRGRINPLRVALLLVAILAPIGDPGAQPLTVPDTVGQRVLACAVCHGADGEGLKLNEYNPRLAGKPAGYLFNQLVNFREHRRKHDMMSYIVRFLSDDFLREMAVHYAALRPPYPPPKNALPHLHARGEALVKNGDPSRDIPACTACHGSALTGMEPAIPGLVGLNFEYVFAQIASWKSGARKAHAPDCMGRVAAKVDGNDIEAISAWLAAQPASPERLPAPAGSLVLPMECGSE